MPIFTHEEMTLRAAIFDVIDEGSLEGFWSFYESDEDFANEQRADFADAVIERIRELKGKP